MYIRLDRPHRILPVIIGMITLASVAALLVWDVFPARFPANAHDILGSLPLVLIAIAYLVYQAVHRPTRNEVVKAALLAVAFLFWAANQLWPHLAYSTLLNDVAIALFVLDVFLIIVGWPTTSPDESFAETYATTAKKPEISGK